MSADGCKGYKNIPSDEAIRDYCAQNKEISHRRIENKEVAERTDKSYKNIDNLFTAVNEIILKNSRLLFDAHLVWTSDLPAVDGTPSKWAKGFTSSDTTNGEE